MRRRDKGNWLMKVMIKRGCRGRKDADIEITEQIENLNKWKRYNSKRFWKIWNLVLHPKIREEALGKLSMGLREKLSQTQLAELLWNSMFALPPRDGCMLANSITGLIWRTQSARSSKGKPYLWKWLWLEPGRHSLGAAQRAWGRIAWLPRQ